MATQCQNLMAVCAVRASRLNADLSFVTSSATGAIAKCGGIGKVTWTPKLYVGPDIQEPDGCGGLAVARKYDDLVIRYDLEVDFITESPEMHELLYGATLLTSGGNTVGYADPIDISCAQTVDKAHIALECWGERVDCQGVLLALPYAVQVFPNAVLQSDARTLAPGVSHFMLKGYSTSNPNFGNGPFNDLAPLVGVTGWGHAELHTAGLPTCDATCSYVATPANT